MTLLEFADSFIRCNLDLTPKSAEQLRITVRRFDEFARHSVRIDELSRELVSDFLRNRLVRFARETVKRNRRHLLQLWREAAEQGLITPPPKIATIRCPRPLPKAIPLATLTRLLHAANQQTHLMRGTTIQRSLFWRSILLFIYDVGSRLTATLDVEWTDLDVDNRVAVLRHGVAKTKLGQLLDFSEQTADELRLLRHVSTSSKVWPYPYCKRQIWAQFKALMIAAGLSPERGIAFHALRKTHASMTAAVTNRQTACDRMGHTSLSMTERYIDPRLLKIVRVADQLPRP